MSYDGTIRLDTQIDNKGIEKGIASASDLAKTGMAALGVAITATVGSIAKLGSSFEADMSRVKAISGAVGQDFVALTNQAKELGASTSFSASEAAKGMENLASAGFNAREIMSAMPGLLDLAAVSGGDVAMAAENVATAVRSFGLEAEQAGHVADVFARAAADTNAEVYDMGEAMKYVAPVSKAMGISMEETAAAIGIMSDAGIKGSQAGTALRGALARIAANRKPVKEALEDLGISFYGLDGKMVSLKDQIKILKTSFVGLTDQQKQNYLINLYGAEALSGMLALIDAGPEKLDELTESFIYSDGAAAEMAKTIKDNLLGDVEELGGAVETLSLELYDMFKDSLRNNVQGLTNAIVFLTDNLDILVAGVTGLGAAFASYQIVSTIVAMSEGFKVAQASLVVYNSALMASTTLTASEALAISAKTLAVGVLTGKISLAAAAQAVWNGVILANPIGVIALAIGAVVAAVIVLNKKYSETDTVTNKLMASTKALKKDIDNLNKSMSESEDAHNKKTDSIAIEARATSDLIGKVEKLSEKENKNAGDKLLLSDYVNTLNSAVEGLNLTYDSNTDKLSLNGKELSNVAKELGSLAEAYKRQAEEQVRQERLLELVRERATAEEMLAKAQKDVAQAEENAGIKSGEAIERRMSASGNYVLALTAEEKAVESAREAVEKAQSAYDISTNKVDDYAKSIASSSTEVTKFAIEMATAFGQINTLVNSIGENSSSAMTEFNTMLASSNMSVEDFAKSVADNVEAINNSFSLIPEQFELSLDEFMEIQRTNVERYQEFRSNIVELSGKIPQEALLELQALGPGANSILEELIAGGETKWSEYAEIYQDKARLATESAVQEISNGELEAASVQAISNAAMAVLGDSSLSEAMESSVVDGIAAASNASEGAYQVGADISAGIARGITSNIALIVAGAESAVDEALYAARRAADAHSPARRFIPLGRDMNAGIAIGLEDANFTVEAASSLIDKARLATEEQTAGIGMRTATFNYNTTTGATGSATNVVVNIDREAINNEMDIDRVARKIGEKTAKQIRLHGGIITDY